MRTMGNKRKLSTRVLIAVGSALIAATTLAGCDVASHIQSPSERLSQLPPGAVSVAPVDPEM